MNDPRDYDDGAYHYDASGSLLNPTRQLPFNGPIEFKPGPLELDAQAAQNRARIDQNRHTPRWFHAL